MEFNYGLFQLRVFTPLMPAVLAVAHILEEMQEVMVLEW
jgi:hypothetical protein